MWSCDRFRLHRPCSRSLASLRQMGVLHHMEEVTRRRPRVRSARQLLECSSFSHLCSSLEGGFTKECGHKKKKRKLRGKPKKKKKKRNKSICCGGGGAGRDWVVLVGTSRQLLLLEKVLLFSDWLKHSGGHNKPKSLKLLRKNTVHLWEASCFLLFFFLSFISNRPELSSSSVLLEVEGLRAAAQRNALQVEAGLMHWSRVCFFFLYYFFLLLLF